ncbi:MAG: DUF4270 family protein [Paludibacteraceae bacterium]|nr:DUF4270 family protein [Paludibacteraceae bacterium]
MKGKGWIIGLLAVIACCWAACKEDVANTGESVLDEDDAIIVLADTFSLVSAIDSCQAIISQADSFLLGEIETDYGLLRASILTQLACPEGYHYPEGFSVEAVDSVCLFLSYASWVGDANSPMAINAYLMDRGTFLFTGTYPTDLNISEYCSREKAILQNRRIVIASEKLDSVGNAQGTYVPMIRMRLNDDFTKYFASIQSFESQEAFNEQFNGLLIETSFGSSTILNITDVALGVYYHFSYKKGDRDTVVNDMKAFYANSEVRTVNHLYYQDKKEWIEQLQIDSDTYNYIVAPAGVYTRMRFPMLQIADTIHAKVGEKRPYVNKAEVRVMVNNMFTGTASEITRNDWLQPANYMLLIREESTERFFSHKELPTDTCALLSQLTQGTDTLGNTIYYYSYDMSDFMTNQLRQKTNDTILNMLLVPVSVEYTSSAVSSVRQQQTMSATQISSAKNGMKYELVYSGF